MKLKKPSYVSKTNKTRVGYSYINAKSGWGDGGDTNFSVDRTLSKVFLGSLERRNTNAIGKWKH